MSFSNKMELKSKRVMSTCGKPPSDPVNNIDLSRITNSFYNATAKSYKCRYCCGLSLSNREIANRKEGFFYHGRVSASATVLVGNSLYPWTDLT